VIAEVSARALLMGAPDFFSIRGGANPHTRNVLGLRKRVRRSLAIAQWGSFAGRLSELGAAVFVVPPDPLWPGLVYPANAGALVPLEAARPVAEKRFVLSNLIHSRSGETAVYRSFLTQLGFRPVEIRSRFEGEADFFPVGEDLYLFTHGTIVRQRFELRLGVPPWTRRYGFRSEQAALDELRAFVPGREILDLELRLEAFYHGDTCLAAFGPERGFLLAYLDALTPASSTRLHERLRDRIVPLGESDAAIYAANAFRLRVDGEERLVLPQGTSRRLQDDIRARGVTPILIDVSEFWKKGGGSVKCMIGDLGPLDEPASPEIAAFRDQVRYRQPSRR
jgi:N-dimethylarginine dimethylaminohydrolase